MTKNTEAWRHSVAAISEGLCPNCSRALHISGWCWPCRRQWHLCRAHDEIVVNCRYPVPPGVPALKCLCGEDW